MPMDTMNKGVMPEGGEADEMAGKCPKCGYAGALAEFEAAAEGGESSAPSRGPVDPMMMEIAKAGR